MSRTLALNGQAPAPCCSGPILLFGSGETAPGSRPIYDTLLRRLPRPMRIAVLETPAGFQPNSAQVAGRVADFMRHRLQTYRPDIRVIPARKRGTPFSPDDPQIVAPMQGCGAFFLGPGSPSYAVRQLQGSLAWQTLLAHHRLGVALILASAATIAVGRLALPVYEIYKVGADLHWLPGLDLLGPYGLDLIWVPHWNNREGGEELDTSRCFMGRERFARLQALLPPAQTIVGIDEHTALLLDLESGSGEVLGKGGVTLLRGGQEQRFAAGATFPLAAMGPFTLPQELPAGLPQRVWEKARVAMPERCAPVPPPEEVWALVRERSRARARRDWATADTLREEILALGWQVLDTPEGPQVEPLR